MHRRTLIAIIILATGVRIAAQSITGVVKNNTGEIIPYANVVLQTTDSVFVTGTTSDKTGNFTVKDFSTADYILSVSYIGYHTEYIKLLNVNRSIDIGPVLLEEESLALEGVTVVASNVTNRVDRQVILPTAVQLASSSSGYDLLNKLMLPGISVNTLENAVSTTGGGTVELRINDVKSTSAQVVALEPSQVIRIEYIDNPGIRYADKGVSAVINYIVKRKESGVSGGINLSQAVTTGFGNDNLYLNANYKKSEFGLNYYFGYRNYDHRYSNATALFHLPGNNSFQREFLGKDAPFKYTDQDVQLSYNYTQPDKRILNIVFLWDGLDTPYRDLAQTLMEEDREEIDSYTRIKDNENRSSIDLYYQEKLSGRQTLTLNLVGTYLNTDFFRNYQEWVITETEPYQYAYGTDGNRYSLIGEGIYGKEWNKIKLNAGIQFTQAYTRNSYTGDVTKLPACTPPIGMVTVKSRERWPV